MLTGLIWLRIGSRCGKLLGLLSNYQILNENSQSVWKTDSKLSMVQWICKMNRYYDPFYVVSAAGFKLLIITCLYPLVRFFLPFNVLPICNLFFTNDIRFLSVTFRRQYETSDFLWVNGTPLLSYDACNAYVILRLLLIIYICNQRHCFKTQHVLSYLMKIQRKGATK